MTKLLFETRTIEELRAIHSPPLDRENSTPYILLVDDDLFANKLAQFVLAKEGYEVETAGDPLIAIQMIKRREPNLLILGITMPYMNDFQLAEKLHTEGYKIPFIFLTAQNSLEATLHGFDIGADDHIAKPYHYRVLLVRVRALIRRLYGKAF